MVNYSSRSHCMLKDASVSFAPDGRTLYAATISGGFSRLCRIDPATGKVIDERPMLLGKSNGRFSPDGRWLAMRDESGEELRSSTPRPWK